MRKGLIAFLLVISIIIMPQISAAPTCNNNNILNVGEACDDGNFNENDGCNSQCQYALPSNGNIHWVDEANVMERGCSTSGDGMTVPWCSLQQVEGYTFPAGHSVVFRAGDYQWANPARSSGNTDSNADVQIKGSGTAQNPIVIMAHPNERVILRNTPNTGIYSPAQGLSVIGTGGRNYQIFQGFTIYGSMTIHSGSYNIVRNNTFYGITSGSVDSNYEGIWFDSGTNNLVRNNRFYNFRGDGDGNNAGIYFYNNAKLSNENNVVENNYFYNNDRGISDKDYSTGNKHRKNVFENNNKGLRICGQYGCSNNILEQNLFKNDGGMYSNYKGSISNNIIRNNVMINSEIFIHDSCGGGNNYAASFYNNIQTGGGQMYVLCPTPTWPYFNNNMYTAFQNAVEIQYGTYPTFSQWQSNYGYDTNSQITNPLFAETERYTLSTSSPARNAGRYGEDLGLYPDGDISVVIGLAQPSGTPPPPICNNNNICEPGSGETVLNCPSDCQVSQTCGNNVREGTEVCDGTDRDGELCTTVPGTFTGGTLTCNAECSAFDTSACTSDSSPVDCSNPDYVWCDDFENFDRQNYNDYDEAADISTVSNPGPFNTPGNTVVEFRGVDDLVKYIPPADSYYMRWYQYYEPGFDFAGGAHGSGLHAGGHDYLALSDIYADSWYEAFLEADTNGNGAFLYSYSPGMYMDCPGAPNPSPYCYGDQIPSRLPSSFGVLPQHEATTDEPTFQSGEWYCMEVFMDGGTVSTDGSVRDGTLNFWIDDVEYGPWDDLWFRSNSNVKIDIAYLRIYDTSPGYFIDNLAVSPNRIGCGAPPVNECGNGQIDAGEECDGNLLNGNECTDLNFDSGTLTCNPVTCQYDIAACTTVMDPIIVDDGDVGTSSDGNWVYGGMAGGYNNDYLYSDPATTSGFWYQWERSLPAGSYELSAWWQEFYSRPSDVSYVITHAGGQSTVPNIDQSFDGSQWNVLGTFDFDGPATVRVISGGNGGSDGGTSADAVRFVRVGDISGCVLGGYDLALPCGTINIQDLTTLINYYATTNTQYDYNNDGKINIIDLVTQIQHWN